MKEQYHALRAYSPYHNLPPLSAALLPALLLTTAENDSRVASWQAKKFAAALAERSSCTPGGARSSRPLLLKIHFGDGHGVGSPLAKRVGKMTDMWSFIAAELCVCAPVPAESGIVGAKGRGLKRTSAGEDK